MRVEVNRREGSALTAREQLRCRRCGEPMKLVIVISKFADQAGYDVFGCERCGSVEWIEHGGELRRTGSGGQAKPCDVG